MLKFTLYLLGGLIVAAILFGINRFQSEKNSWQPVTGQPMDYTDTEGATAAVDSSTLASLPDTPASGSAQNSFEIQGQNTDAAGGPPGPIPSPIPLPSPTTEDIPSAESAYDAVPALPENPAETRTDSAEAVPVSAYHRVIATFFWAGEPASADNSYIANDQSAWDESWAAHFGGFDDPDDRCGYRPCGFVPRENPFYFALPYDNLDENGNEKPAVSAIPWYDPGAPIPLLKNRWTQITFGNKTCYGQWEDVGPYESDDFDYVFGSAPPKNRIDSKAGIDLSPALRDCLGMADNGTVSWRFVAANEVPAGPWKEIVTTSGYYYK